MIRILTDTGADCSREELDLLNVQTVNLPVTFDGEEECCSDTEEFWEKLIAGKVARTSQPSLSDLKTCFEQAKQAGDDLVVILISSHMSGTYESALQVKEEVGYDRIFVVDSLNASVAEKMLVLHACKLRDANKSAQEIAENLQEFRTRVRLIACIDTLKYLVRGGRLSKAAGNIGELLNLKPLITFVDGHVRNFGKVFGTALGAKRLVSEIKRCKISGEYPIIPIYSYDDKNCLSFVDKANEAGADIDFMRRTPIGATIGTHIGPGGFGAVYVLEKE